MILHGPVTSREQKGPDYKPRALVKFREKKNTGLGHCIPQQQQQVYIKHCWKYQRWDLTLVIPFWKRMQLFLLKINRRHQGHKMEVEKWLKNPRNLQHYMVLSTALPPVGGDTTCNNSALALKSIISKSQVSLLRNVVTWDWSTEASLYHPEARCCLIEPFSCSHAHPW